MASNLTGTGLRNIAEVTTAFAKVIYPEKLQWM